MGGTLMADYREWFDALFRALLDDQFPEAVRKRFDIPPEIDDPKQPYVVPLPSDGSVFDYKFIKKGKGEWKPWLDDLKDVPPIPRDMPVNQIIVSTVETVRYFHFFHMLVSHHKPILMVGPTGTGKSVYIMEYLLKRTDPEVFKPLFVIFSAQTTANQTQDIIMSKLDRRRKGLFCKSGISISEITIISFDHFELLLRGYICVIRRAHSSNCHRVANTDRRNFHDNNGYNHTDDLLIRYTRLIDLINVLSPTLP